MPARTYQNYEGGMRAPNTEAWECFVRAGINANWLLTGEGPMLLADLAPPAVAAQSLQINVDTLKAVIEGALRAAPKAPADKLASLCALMYQEVNVDILPTPKDGGSYGAVR